MTVSKHMRDYWNERDREAAELRATGLTWQQIGDQMGMTMEAARKSAKRHHERQQMEAAE